MKMIGWDFNRGTRVSLATDQNAKRLAMCFAPRPQSSFGAWGIARGSVKFKTISDEIPGAMPHAERDVAPSARNANLRHPYKA